MDKKLWTAHHALKKATNERQWKLTKKNKDISTAVLFFFMGLIFGVLIMLGII